MLLLSAKQRERKAKGPRFPESLGKSKNSFLDTRASPGIFSRSPNRGITKESPSRPSAHCQSAPEISPTPPKNPDLADSQPDTHVLNTDSERKPPAHDS